MQARRGELMDALEGEGLIATNGGERVGLIAWFADARAASAEIRALAVAAARQSQGVGRALLVAAADALRARGVQRVWLTTTNENLAALALYQKVGYRLAALHRGAIDELRRTLKPRIPLVSGNGIAVHDELELELLLD